MLLTFCSSTSSSSSSFCGDSTFVCCICFLRVVAVNEFPMAWHKIIHKYWDFSIGTQATDKSLNTHTHKLTPIDQSDSSNSRDFNLKWFFSSLSSSSSLSSVVLPCVMPLFLHGSLSRSHLGIGYPHVIHADSILRANMNKSHWTCPQFRPRVSNTNSYLECNISIPTAITSSPSSSSISAKSNRTFRSIEYEPFVICQICSFLHPLAR